MAFKKAFEQREGNGALFINDDKQHENHADYNGSITINGQEYWLNAWKKESQNGKRYLSVSAKPKQARATGSVQKVAQGQKQEEHDFDDELPF